MKLAELHRLIKEEKNLYEYAEEFQDFIYKNLKNKKIFGGWELDTDLSGTFYFTHFKNDLTVMATPLWDGQELVPFTIVIDNNDKKLKSVKFKPTFNVRKDTPTYLKILKTGLKKIEKGAY